VSNKTVRYRVTNWSDYNKALIQRGDITLWLTEEVIDCWQTAPPSGKPGRPRTYSDLAVQCMLVLRLFYRLPLRAAQGLMASLLLLLDCPLRVPDYTTLCRRQRSLGVKVQADPAEEPRHILIDSTGLKVFGEGEWKVRQHGKDKRRTWRKLHLAIDARTQEIVAAALTTNSLHDCQMLPRLLLEVEGEITRVTTDGAYDTWECRYEISTRRADAVIPPRSNARLTECDIPEAAQRDQAVEAIREEGLKHWKESSGYHRRSLVETAMFRVKSTFGDKMKARVIQNQIAEAVLKSNVLNQFIHLGMPETERELV
jgi:hypothetical protein